MNSNASYIKMFSNCIPVLGEKQSVIYDLQRKQALHIPNDLYDFIQLSEKHTIVELVTILGEENKIIVEEYIHFLITKELAFFINKDEIDLYPKLSMAWESPSLISNAIVEISEINEINFDQIITKLTTLGCEYLYLKIQTKIPLITIEKLIKKLENTMIYTVVFEATLQDEENIQYYEELVVNHKRIETIFLLSEIVIQTASKKIMISSKETFVTHKASFFAINLALFTESQAYNTYFNKKMYINSNGEILNAPETTEIYGYIKDVSFEKLKTIVKSKAFQKYWRISKDMINECKNCELRYMCVDNRVPIKSKEVYTFSTSCDIKN